MSRGIYESPYDAFTNYMNILGDFIKRVDSLYPVEVDNEELNALLTTIKNQDSEIEELRKELDKHLVLEEKMGVNEEKKAAKKSSAKKPSTASKKVTNAEK